LFSYIKTFGEVYQDKPLLLSLLKVLSLLLGRIWLGYHWCFRVGARSCGEEPRIQTESGVEGQQNRAG